MTIRKIKFAVVAAGLLALAVAVFWFWPAHEAAKPPPLAKLTLAMTRVIRSAPLEIAFENGYFREEGLDVTPKYKDVGWQALKDVLEDRADIATVAETPVVYAALDKRKYTQTDRGDFVIIAEMIASQGTEGGLARKDRGVLAPANLRGKTIGLPSGGTTADFVLDSFLAHHRLRGSEVKIVRMEVTALGSALETGEVDAVFFWEPHLKRWRDKLGANGVSLAPASGYTTSWLLVAMKDFAAKRSDLLVRFLRAVERAERFIRQHPDQTLDILAKQGVHTRDLLAELKSNEFSLSLNQALLSVLEYEARWMIRNNLSDKTGMPDFLELIDTEPLAKVKPASVGIVK